MGSLGPWPPDIYRRRLWSACSWLDGALRPARQNKHLHHHTGHVLPGPFPTTTGVCSPTKPTGKGCTHRRSANDDEPIPGSDLVDERSGHVQFAGYRRRNALFSTSCAPAGIGQCDGPATSIASTSSYWHK